MNQENELRPLADLVAMIGNPLAAGELATELGRHREAIISGIDTKAAQHVRGTARQLNLSEEITSEVLFCLAGLIEFERFDKDAIKTNQERRVDLEQIAYYSRALAYLLTSTDLGNSIGLLLKGNELACNWSSYDIGRFRPIPDRVQLETLAAAADELRDDIPSGASGGRRRLLSAYARHVARLWEAVEPSGMQPGRGGDFECLCDAIFEAAGVHAKAEGAIRHFMSNLLGKPKGKVISPLSKSDLGPVRMDKTGSGSLRKKP